MLIKLINKSIRHRSLGIWAKFLSIQVMKDLRLITENISSQDQAIMYMKRVKL